MTPKEIEAEFAAFTDEETLRQRSLATLAPQPSEIYDFSELVKVDKWGEVDDLVDSARLHLGSRSGVAPRTHWTPRSSEPDLVVSIPEKTP